MLSASPSTGIAVELVVAPPERFGTELLRATGSPEYVASLGELPEAPDEEGVYALLGLPWCPPELREAALLRAPPALVELADIRGDLHCHTTWSDGKASVEEMAIAARDLGYEYIAICDHTPNVRVVPGPRRRRAARTGGGDRRRERVARAVQGAARDRVRHPQRRRRSIFPTTCSRSSTGCSSHSTRASARRADRLTKKVTEAMRHPAVRCLSHPKGRIINHRPPNALDLERVLEVALEEGVALETNGLPDRLDLRDEEVRLAVESGVQVVCSTDAHSVRGLGNMRLAVATARRGWAGPGQILNTRGLDEVLGLRR